VMFLPHGFEGQGPEHSSARLERFLCLAAEDNIQIVYPTTPAQFFHVLRRQVLRPWRKPLVVLTPKSLLRHKEVVSPLDDLTRDRFRRVLMDPEPPKKSIERVLMCSGKVAYDLMAARRERERDDVLIVRIEQLYPLPLPRLEREFAEIPDGTPVFWVQEEPENMGAWTYMRYHFSDDLLGRFPFIGITREASASPATGSASSHRLEQQDLMDKAFRTEARTKKGKRTRRKSVSVNPQRREAAC